MLSKQKASGKSTAHWLHSLETIFSLLPKNKPLLKSPPNWNRYGKSTVWSRDLYWNERKKEKPKIRLQSAFSMNIFTLLWLDAVILLSTRTFILRVKCNPGPGCDSLTLVLLFCFLQCACECFTTFQSPHLCPELSITWLIHFYTMFVFCKDHWKSNLWLHMF